MKLTSRATIAAAGAALVLAAGAGGALAAGGDGNGPGPGRPDRPAASAAVASYLGLTADELRAQLRSGKTLAEIAAAQGKSVDGLESAVLAAAKARLDQAVAAGTLTAAQEQTRLANLQEHLDDLVNGTCPAASDSPGKRGGDGFGHRAGHGRP